MKKTFLLFGLFAVTVDFTKAQNVNIPDVNFKIALCKYISTQNNPFKIH